MTPFMKGPFRAPSEDIRRCNYYESGADMTPFMKGPFGPPWNTYDDPIYESRRRHDAIYERPLQGPP